MYIAESTDTPCQRYDPNLWFAKEGSVKTGMAKRMCRAWCAERQACLAGAMRYESREGSQPGVFGGLTSSDRRKLREKKKDKTLATV